MKETVGNYRPVSILNGMSKTYERWIHNSLSSSAETVLSSFISANKKILQFKSCLIETYRKLEKILRQ